MVDQTPTTPTPTPPVPVQQLETDAKAVVNSLSSRIEAWLKNFYTYNKFLFYCVLPVVGLLYVVIKYREIIVDILVKGGANVLKTAEQKDQTLADKADAAKQQANDLVNQANQLPNQEQQPGEDWYQK